MENKQLTLQLKNLFKTYSNGVKAMDDINLDIHSGMFGLLGPNGAGKSSLMRTIATLQEPDTGSIVFNGIDVLKNPVELRKKLGYLPQEFGVYPRINAYDLLDHLSILKGITKKKERKELVEALLNRVNLYKFRKKNVNKFSGGMKQRVGIAQALIGDPELIIVDEPTAGLDPGERNRFYNLLADISEDKIVILSTHIVADVVELCQDFVIMNEGKVVYKGRPSEAIADLNNKIWSKKIGKDEVAQYEAEYNVLSKKMIGGQPVISILSEENPQNGFYAQEPSLEEVFFNYIKK